jgi:hypothetical protein
VEGGGGGGGRGGGGDDRHVKRMLLAKNFLLTKQVAGLCEGGGVCVRVRVYVWVVGE